MRRGEEREGERVGGRLVSKWIVTQRACRVASYHIASSTLRDVQFLVLMYAINLIR